MQQTYIVYGLYLQSEIPLPELIPTLCDNPDVIVRYGDVPTHLRNPLGRGGFYEACSGCFLLTVPKVARYLVLDGKEIQIGPAPSSTDEDIRAFLLGSVLGAVMHQRHILPLHASCIQTTRGAVLFAGRSGDGKSTLLAALMQRGYAMLADDVTGITLDTKGLPIVLPAFPRTRLWADMVTKLQYPLEEAHRLRSPLEKYVIPALAFYPKPLRIHTIYCLTSHQYPEICIELVSCLERFAQIANNTYRFRFLEALDVRQPHFHTVMKLTQTSQVKQVKRPLHPFMLKELVDCIETEINS